MKKKRINSIKALGLLFLIIIGTKMFSVIPWWGFVIPVFLFGMMTAVKQWEIPALFLGFLAGFIIWFGANLFFHLSYDGIILNRIGIGVGILILFFSGLIGGLLTALAFYTGKSLVGNKQADLQL
jgi:hypothetical protein